MQNIDFVKTLILAAQCGPAALHHSDMTTLSNAQKAELENQGYTVAKGLLPLDVCRRCCEMVDVFLGLSLIHI